MNTITVSASSTSHDGIARCLTVTIPLEEDYPSMKTLPPASVLTLSDFRVLELSKSLFAVMEGLPQVLRGSDGQITGYVFMHEGASIPPQS